MDNTEKHLAVLELAVKRLRDAEAALNAARLDVETEAVAAVRAGGDVREVAGLSGIAPGDIAQLGAIMADNPPA
ncbi:hypothetical protein [Streptomyces sp. A5-4]|uniref:hypothetical protein n=1 Tax=Streptomyces sp. A5-4 TaxID=3384771 RepID=UPI003DA7FB2C